MSNVNRLSKSKALANSDNDGTLKAAAILPVDIEGNIKFQTAGVFLLNPSTFTENKSSNWAQQQVPGQSDPVLQWTSSGPRTVSFQALVTIDTSNYVTNANLKPGNSSDPFEKGKTLFGQIAANFFKVAAPTPRESLSFGEQIGISSYLDYYRSLLYPTYSQNNKLSASPPLVVLVFGSSLNKFQFNQKITTDSDVWVVTNLEIQVTKQLPSLAPMEALVTFQLTQYTINSFSRERFLR